MSGVMNAFIVLEANRKGRCLSISRLVVFGAGEEVLLRVLGLLIESENLFITFFFLSSALVLTLTVCIFILFYVFFGWY